MPFESLGAVSYLPFLVTMAVSVAICEIFSIKEWCDLENRVRVQGHWKWHQTFQSFPAMTSQVAECEA